MGAEKGYARRESGSFLKSRLYPFAISVPHSRRLEAVSGYMKRGLYRWASELLVRAPICRPGERRRAGSVSVLVRVVQCCCTLFLSLSAHCRSALAIQCIFRRCPCKCHREARATRVYRLIIHASSRSQSYFQRVAPPLPRHAKPPPSAYRSLPLNRTTCPYFCNFVIS